MTALNKYQRLEGPGLWRSDPAEQRRDVVVALGKASLVITDSRSGEVLSHWSLPATKRTNPGKRPAIFVPVAEGDMAAESLELDEPALIEALETIQAALAPDARRGRVRLALGGGVLAAVAALAVFWLPDALSQHTARIVPPASRAQIGREALDGLTAANPAIRICAEPAGRQAMATLRGRVLGASYRVAVVDGLPGFEAGHLPGRLVVVGAGLLERLDGPEALAGYLMAEQLVAEANDPLLDLLRHAGIRATLALLTTGGLSQDAAQAFADSRLQRPPARPDPAQLTEGLAALGVSAAPYANALPASATELAQSLADQAQSMTRASARILSDGEWITLQGVCQN